MAHSVRKQLIIKLIEEGFTNKQIAEKAQCGVSYVYNIRSEWKKSKAALSHNWEPKWWELMLIVCGVGSALYFIIASVLSF